MSASPAVGPTDLSGYPRELLLDMLRRMWLIRAFDSMLPKLYTEGLIRGSSHSAIGMEASAVGACAALQPDDLITSTHRGHGHTIAKGGDVQRMMAELLGRADGYCRGKGGSMHIADFQIGMLGANGIVGGGIGIACGAALTSKLRRPGVVTACFFGDGAINQGIFHEVANLAAIWRLPLLFICEDNGFAMSARSGEMIAGDDIARRADAYGFPGVSVDGQDVLAVHDTVAGAAAQARSGAGPALIVSKTYRFEGHFSGDTMRYRSSAEAAPWLERDPIKLLASRLLEADAADAAALEDVERSARVAVADALQWAKESPLPEKAEALTDVYA